MPVSQGPGYQDRVCCCWLLCLQALDAGAQVRAAWLRLRSELLCSFSSSHAGWRDAAAPLTPWSGSGQIAWSAAIRGGTCCPAGSRPAWSACWVGAERRGRCPGLPEPTGAPWETTQSGCACSARLPSRPWTPAWQPSPCSARATACCACWAACRWGLCMALVMPCPCSMGCTQPCTLRLRPDSLQGDLKLGTERTERVPATPRLGCALPEGGVWWRGNTS